MVRKFSIFFNVIKWLLFACVSAILAANVYTIVRRSFFNDEFPTVFGFGSAVVVSDSMETEISRGDVIIIQRRDSYENGDVLTYRDGDSFTTHRLMRTQNGEYILQGDANDSEDAPVSPERVVGKVVLILPKFGKMLDFFKSELGLVILLVVGIGIIFLPDWIRDFVRAKQAADGEEKPSDDGLKK